MEEEAAIFGKGAREGAEAKAHFGLSAFYYYPPPPSPKATGEDL